MEIKESSSQASRTLDDSCWMKPVRKDDTIRDGMVELEQERGSFKKNKKTLWPLFMDGVQLPQG